MYWSLARPRFRDQSPSRLPNEVGKVTVGDVCVVSAERTQTKVIDCADESAVVGDVGVVHRVGGHSGAWQRDGSVHVRAARVPGVYLPKSMVTIELLLLGTASESLVQVASSKDATTRVPCS
jgi:hypothetical protein